MSSIQSNPFGSSGVPIEPADASVGVNDSAAIDQRSDDQLSADVDRFSSLVSDRSTSRNQQTSPRTSQDEGNDSDGSSERDDVSNESHNERSGGSESKADSREQQQLNGRDWQPIEREVSTDTEYVDLNSAENDAVAAEFSGNAILQSFASQQSQPVLTPPTSSVSATPTTVDAAQSVDALATQIADRILVSDPSQAGTDEVRILLKDSVLAQTEVRITRDGGSLQVEFVTQSDASFDLLDGHQFALQDRLAKKADQSVKVAVTHAGQQDANSDGRSRQRQDVEIEEAP